MNIDDTADLSNIPVNDRLRMIEAIWDSISNDFVPPPTRAQQDELDRRLAAHEADPSSAITFEELKRRLDSRK